LSSIVWKRFQKIKAIPLQCSYGDVFDIPVIFTVITYPQTELQTGKQTIFREQLPWWPPKIDYGRSSNVLDTGRKIGLQGWFCSEQKRHIFARPSAGGITCIALCGASWRLLCRRNYG